MRRIGAFELGQARLDSACIEPRLGRRGGVLALIESRRRIIGDGEGLGGVGASGFDVVLRLLDVVGEGFDALSLAFQGGDAFGEIVDRRLKRSQPFGKTRFVRRAFKPDDGARHDRANCGAERGRGQRRDPARLPIGDG